MPITNVGLFFGIFKIITKFVEGIFSVSNYIFLWHESEDIKKKKKKKKTYFWNLSWF